MAEAKSPFLVTCMTPFPPKTKLGADVLFSLCQQMPGKNYKYALAGPNIRQETLRKKTRVEATMEKMQLVWV